MRYMIIVKATRDSESGMLPTESKMAEMARYHEELQKAGLLVDASGLQATSNGWRVRYDGEERIVTDGPFVETKELIAGYTVIRTRTREEALAWSRRFPNPDLNDAPCEIEVRRMFDLEDFEPTAAVEQFRRIGVGGE